MESLLDARAGQLVVRHDGQWLSIEPIEAVTATQILMKGAGEGTRIRFRRSDGSEIGGLCYQRIEAGTDARLREVRDELKKRRIVEQFGHRNWANVPLVKLEEIERVLAQP